MNKWRYCVVVGSATAFFIPIVEQTNLRLLERELEESFFSWKMEALDRVPYWFPGGRESEQTGYSASAIRNEFFFVRIHRYAKGATEIDISEKSIVSGYLCRQKGGQKYGEEWQGLKLSNPNCWLDTGILLYAEENWDSLYTRQTMHTKLDFDFAMRRYERERKAGLMGKWEQQDLLGYEGSYGGTN